jgi:hypothetical protein
MVPVAKPTRLADGFGCDSSPYLAGYNHPTKFTPLRWFPRFQKEIRLFIQLI